MRENDRPAYRIADLEISDRPRERLVEKGASSLNKAELLAILLRTGVPGENAVQVGQRLLDKFGGLEGIQRASIAEICDQHGVGEAKAAQIKAAIELGSRLKMDKVEDRPTINSPEDVADLYKYDLAELEQEVLLVILLDTRNHLIEKVEIYRGSVNSSQVRVAEIFTPAVRRNATSVIVVHNHPSGDPTPSPDDVSMTRAIIQAGKLLDIDVLDHMVIARNGFVSLKQRGLGFV
jgi:DNA repair protein RadC